MDNPEEIFKSDSEKVYLLRAEKDAMKKRILNRAPVFHPQKSPFVFFSRMIFAPLAVLLLVCVPVTYAAQSSGPGDFLYDIEIAVLEPVQETLQFGVDAKVAYHTARLEERLDELQSLGDVEEEDLDRVAENVQDHARDITVTLASTTENAKKITYLIKSKALIEAHEEVFEELHIDVDDVASTSEEISDDLIETSDALVEQVGEESIESVIIEAVEEIRDIASSTATTTQEIVNDQIEDITAALERGNLKQALDLSNETHAEALKERYLEVEE